MLTFVAIAGGVSFAARASAQVMDDRIYAMVAFDELEYRRIDAADPVRWDMRSWIGGDFTRLWIKSEGTQATVGADREADIQALYSRLVAPFWEVQAGVRLDTRHVAGTGHARVLAVVGLEGLAPYWFELEPAVFVDGRANVSARLTASLEMFFTQRLIGQPRVELNAAIQSVPEFGVGAGLNDLDLGYRVRYEFRRSFAPYVGITWKRRFGATATLARQAGETVGAVAMVGGIRAWF